MSTIEKESANDTESGADHWGARLLLILARIACYLPWIWLALFAFYVLAVAFQVGHLPTYGQPDPKDAGAASLLYLPVLVLLLLVMATIPIGAGLSAVRLLRGVPQVIRRGEAIAYLVGISLLLLFVMNDLAGLMTWLGD